MTARLSVGGSSVDAPLLLASPLVADLVTATAHAQALARDACEAAPPEALTDGPWVAWEVSLLVVSLVCWVLRAGGDSV
jgi:hypothetical protein